MEVYKLRCDKNGKSVLQVPYSGPELLHRSLYNKGSAFTEEERRKFGLEGLLPPGVCTLQQQANRTYASIERKADAMEKYIGLAALQDRNEVLFYRLLLDHTEELLPIIYTPTVGQACQQFSKIFRQARGIWITPADKGRIHNILANAPFQDVRLIVVTDNERILGLGDQGCGGMGIPVGKLALYTVAAGIHPSQTLPISIDVGTDNPELRSDELYLGYPHPRVRGPEYDELIKEFVQAVLRQFPRALLQWEDFKQQNAFDLLNRYRQVLPSFNDDIQGTAAVAVAGILSAARATGLPMDRQRIVILGAGAAGIGIARLLRDVLQRSGIGGETLMSRIALLDRGGLLIQGRTFKEATKREFAWPEEMAASVGFTPDTPGDLPSVVRALKPNILIGTSGQPGIFDERVVRAMAQHAQRPVIFPFSNPTSKSEGIPRDLIQWTDGRAIVATGSPFPSVEYKGRTIRIGQGNNVYIFPGVGLGVLVSGAKVVTDSMFAVAATTLAQCVSQADLEGGSIYPRITELRNVSARIAVEIVREAIRTGAANSMAESEIEPAVAAAMWTPEYPELEPCRRPCE